MKIGFAVWALQSLSIDTYSNNKMGITSIFDECFLNDVLSIIENNIDRGGLVALRQRYMAAKSRSKTAITPK